MKTDEVIVKKSNIEGKGVFAKKDFEKGEIVLHWNIEDKLTEQELKRLSDDQKKYISEVNGQYIVMHSPEKYVNHSCNPNTISKDFCDVAIRYIKAGKEITSDYSKDMLAGKEMKCNCSYDNCRKIIKSYN